MLEALQKNFSLKALLIAGLAAGTVMLLTNVILNPIVLDVNPGLTLRYFAALLLGSDSLTDDGSGNLVLGVVVHYALSLLFAIPITLLIHRYGLTVGIVGGAILGLALYSINIYTTTALFEWFFALKSSVLLISHVLFGAVAGGVYELFDRYDRPFPVLQESKGVR